MKKVILLTTFLFVSTLIYGQQKIKSYNLELGTSYGNFQDLKLGIPVYSGIGSSYRFFYEKESDNMFTVSLGVANSKRNIKNLAITNSTFLNANLDVSLLKPSNIIKKGKFWVGATLNIDFLLRSSEQLGNNGTYMNYSNNLFASAIYKGSIKNSQLWSYKASFSLGIL